MTDQELLERNRKLLILHFKAKPKDEAKDSDHMVTYTERNQWILSPRSKITGQRKVITQL